MGIELSGVCDSHDKFSTASRPRLCTMHLQAVVVVSHNYYGMQARTYKTFLVPRFLSIIIVLCEKIIGNACMINIMDVASYNGAGIQCHDGIVLGFLMHARS